MEGAGVFELETEVTGETRGAVAQQTLMLPLPVQGFMRCTV